MRYPFDDLDAKYELMCISKSTPEGFVHKSLNAEGFDVISKLDRSAMPKLFASYCDQHLLTAYVVERTA